MTPCFAWAASRNPVGPSAHVPCPTTPCAWAIWPIQPVGVNFAAVVTGAFAWICCSCGGNSILGVFLKWWTLKALLCMIWGSLILSFFCWPMALQKHPTCPYLSPSNHVRMILGPLHFEKHPAELGFVQIGATCCHPLVPGITYASPCVWTRKHLHPLSACCQVFGNASSQLKFVTTTETLERIGTLSSGPCWVPRRLLLSIFPWP